MPTAATFQLTNAVTGKIETVSGWNIVKFFTIGTGSSNISPGSPISTVIYFCDGSQFIAAGDQTAAIASHVPTFGV